MGFGCSTAPRSRDRATGWSATGRSGSRRRCSGFGGAVEGLGGEAEFFDCAGVLNVVSAGLFEEFEIARGAVHGIDEAVDGVALQELVANRFVFAEIGEKGFERGVDVGKLEPAGEGEEGLPRWVGGFVIGDDMRESETFFDDEREESVILGCEHRAGGRTGEKGEHGRRVLSDGLEGGHACVPLPMGLSDAGARFFGVFGA